MQGPHLWPEITALLAPLAPHWRRGSMRWAARPGPARLKLTLALDKNSGHTDRANARAVLDLDAPQLKGITTITAKPEIAAVRGIDLDALRRSEIGVESKLSSPRRAARCWRYWGSIARSRRATARRNSKARRPARGVRRCG